MRGGKRKGAGRPATGRKRTCFYLSDNEIDIVRDIILHIRGDIFVTGIRKGVDSEPKKRRKQPRSAS